jgi:hypothetical protein
VKYRKWLVIGGVVALLGALIGVFGIVRGSLTLRDYIGSHYQRAASRDIGSDARAYTAEQQPSKVDADLTKAWQPDDRFTDDSGVYLRYDDDSVVILPVAAGSLILVERMSTAYPRYRSTVGSTWVWSRGSSVRGGGSGSGK